MDLALAFKVNGRQTSLVMATQLSPSAVLHEVINLGQVPVASYQQAQRLVRIRCVLEGMQQRRFPRIGLLWLVFGQNPSVQCSGPLDRP